MFTLKHFHLFQIDSRHTTIANTEQRLVTMSASLCTQTGLPYLTIQVMWYILGQEASSQKQQVVFYTFKVTVCTLSS